MNDLVKSLPRFLFFTGKGGVGKTSMSCVVASALADHGKRVLLISTDPASNLDEVLETRLSGHPTPVAGAPGLWAMNIDPIQAAAEYRDRIVGPYRGVLPDDAVQSMEEQLSGACTVEIAVFQAFARAVSQGKDRFMVLDTAPTGHTLLLLDATDSYHREVAKNSEGVDQAVKDLLPHLRDPEFTKILLITLPEATPVHEAERLHEDLMRAQIQPFAWVINQSFALSGTRDALLAARGIHELKYIDEVVSKNGDRVVIAPWLANETIGAEHLRALFHGS